MRYEFLQMIEVPQLRGPLCRAGNISIDRRCRHCYSLSVFSSFHQAENPWS